LSKNKYFSAATQQHEDLAKEKARGIKIKEKAIRGSERPISDFEKATQKKKKSLRITQRHLVLQWKKFL